MTLAPYNDLKLNREGFLVGKEYRECTKKSLRTTGQLPEASSNLSAHSGRLVRNLAELGIIRDPRISDVELYLK